MKKLLFLSSFALLLTGCPDEGSGVSNSEVNQAIGDHAAQQSAHHTKTVDAAEITTGVLDPARVPGAAGPKRIPVDVMGVFTGASGAMIVQGLNGGLQFDDGSASFATGFVVPSDFTDDGFIIRLTWTATETGCDVVFLGNYVSWRRPNTPPQSGGSVSAGIVNPGASAAPAVVGQAATLDVVLTAPGGVTGWDDILPGDSIHFGLFRAGANIADTCTGLATVHSIELIYND